LVKDEELVPDVQHVVDLRKESRVHAGQPDRLEKMRVQFDLRRLAPAPREVVDVLIEQKWGVRIARRESADQRDAPVLRPRYRNDRGYDMPLVEVRRNNLQLVLTPGEEVEESRAGIVVLSLGDLVRVVDIGGHEPIARAPLRQSKRHALHVDEVAVDVDVENVLARDRTVLDLLSREIVANVLEVSRHVEGDRLGELLLQADLVRNRLLRPQVGIPERRRNICRA